MKIINHILKIINFIFKAITLMYCVIAIVIQLMALLLIYSFESSSGKIDDLTFFPLNIVLLILMLYYFFKRIVNIRKNNILIFSLGVMAVLHAYIYNNYINVGSFENSAIIIVTVLPVLLIYLSTMINYILYKKSNNK